MTDNSTLKAAHAEIRRERVLSWKQKYQEEYDVPFAPEPTDEELNWLGKRLHHYDP